MGNTSSSSPSSSSGTEAEMGETAVTAAEQSQQYAAMLEAEASKWNPLATKDNTPPTAAALRRIKKELTNFSNEPVEGIYFVLDDEKANIIHALVVGPPDTPYEGGFFYFLLRLPFNYPFKPPLVKLMTTGGGRVRFNPNLYADGKVCLSILGTWTGPAWTPNLNIRTVLLSIQSLMCKEPYFNEPGFESSKTTAAGKKASKKYNAEVRYQTMCVAVLAMMEHGSDCGHMPQVLRDKMKEVFATKIDIYTATLLQNQNQGEESRVQNYRKLQGRFNKLVPAPPSPSTSSANADFSNSSGDQEDTASPSKLGKLSSWLKSFL